MKKTRRPILNSNKLISKKLRIPHDALNFLLNSNSLPIKNLISEIKLHWPLHSHAIFLELANQHSQSKIYSDAILLFKEVIFLNSTDYTALLNLAICLYQVGEYKDSVVYSRKAYQLKPQNLLITKIYLDCLLLTGEALEIDEICTTIRTSFPKDTDLQYFHAQAKRLLGDFDSSLKLLEDLATKTNKNLFKFSVADVIGETNSLKAIEIYESLESQKIEFSTLNKYNLSLHYLRSRNFDKGWAYFEYGLDKDIGAFGRKLPYNFKNTFRADKCEVDPNKWTMICAEQGIGDQLIFLSALTDAVNEFKKIFFVCENRMLPILQRSFPSLNLTSDGKFGDINLFDSEIKGGLGYMPLGSLLERYRPTLNSFIDNKKAFTSVDKDMYYGFRTLLTEFASGRRIIGISWKSKVARNLELVKNIDFLDWLPLFDKDTLIVNLQYGDTSSEQAFVKNLGLEMLSFNNLDFTKDLDQWLALSAACDGIISVSTSLVHFAGACGQRVAVVMPFKQGHWSLGLYETESIFYPRVSIFRRKSDETLTSLILDASSHLKN